MHFYPHSSTKTQKYKATAAHMLLQASRMGLDSCPIGGFESDALTTALALPKGGTPALLIALGHCSYKAPERLRKPLD